MDKEELKFFKDLIMEKRSQAAAGLEEIERVARDDLRAADLAVRREPGGQTPQLRHDPAVPTRHEGNHP